MIYIILRHYYVRTIHNINFNDFIPILRINSINLGIFTDWYICSDRLISIIRQNLKDFEFCLVVF